MTESGTTALIERQRFWLEQVQACEASGKTVVEYAADQGFDARAMYAGKKVLVKKGILPRTHSPSFRIVVAEQPGRLRLGRSIHDV